MGRQVNLNPDTTYTIERMMDLVAWKFKNNPGYWKNYSAVIDARQKANYQPHFDRGRLQEAFRLLSKLESLSLQRLSESRPVRDLSPLQGFSNVRWLSLGSNEISDLSPLRTLTALRELHLTANRVRDISPLQSCVQLERLHLSNNPIGDYGPLQFLPKLRELNISDRQILDLHTCPRLPHLWALRGHRVYDDQAALQHAALDDLTRLPDMPIVAGLEIRGACSLRGIERFLDLRDLNVSGSFHDLSPLRALKKLTSLEIEECSASDVSPLGKLLALRKLRLKSDQLRDVKQLDKLPALREVRIEGQQVSHRQLQRLKTSLSGWDSEFLLERPTRAPSFDLEIVSQSEFDYYDKNPYGLENWDGDRSLLWSERGWLLDRIDDALSVDLEDETDYAIPLQNYTRRSHTVCLYTEYAIGLLRQVVQRIQNILCHARNPWIIYLQNDITMSDAPDTPAFILWIYPDKIVTTKSHAKAVSQLLKL